MTEYETLKRDEIEFGENEFIEVARKKAIGGEGEEDIVSLSRGFYDGDDRRYRSSLSLPAEDDVIAFVRDILPEMLGSD